MGESINIEQRRKLTMRESTSEHNGSRLSKQIASQIGKMRARAKSMLSPLKNTHVELQGKRKKISVKIDRDSIKHISNDIAVGGLPLELANPETLKKAIRNAKQIAISNKDADGIHADKSNKVKDYRYFEITHEDKSYYLNVESNDSERGGNAKRKYRLHAITSKLKNYGK